MKLWGKREASRRIRILNRSGRGDTVRPLYGKLSVADLQGGANAVAPLRAPNVNERDPVALNRVKSLWAIIVEATLATDPRVDDNVRRFLVHVCWHESRFLRTRIQDPKTPGGPDGPARGLPQFEAYRAREGGLHAASSGALGVLSNFSGVGAADLKVAFEALPVYVEPPTPGMPYFPGGNLIERLLRENDLFAVALMRIEFKRFEKPIGTGAAAHADYWLEFWKRRWSDPDLRAKFIANCTTVDALLDQFL